MTNAALRKLLSEVVRDPVQFKIQGKAYQLLEQYFEGAPLDSLVSLLKSNCTLVHHAAIFVASELGRDAAPILRHVIPLTESSDRYVKYGALEVVAVCSTDSHGSAMRCVTAAFEDGEEVIRLLAMRLVCRANSYQIRSARDCYRRRSGTGSAHVFGLDSMLSIEKVDCQTIESMLTSPMALLRKYSAIVIRRQESFESNLVAQLRSNPDEDLKRFVQEWERI